MSRIAVGFATFFGLGRVLPAPGTTAGSLPVAAAVGTVVAAGAAGCWVLAALAVGMLLFGALGGVGAGVEVRNSGCPDPGWVVADEVVGQALTYVVGWSTLPQAGRINGVVWVFLGFLFFRLLDVLKPGPVRWAERLPGAVGVMADDVVAGIGAGLLLALSGFTFWPAA